MIKKLLIGTFVVAALLAGAAYYVLNQSKVYIESPLTLTQAELVTVPAGASFNRAIGLLTKAKWAIDSPYVRLLPKLYPELTAVKAGTYQLLPGMTIYQALNEFTDGQEHQFSITFVEGSRFTDWMDQLAKAPHLSHELTGLSEVEISNRLGISRDRLEGLFLAETYNYTAGTSDLAILKRAHQSLEQVLSKHWAERNAQLPLKNEYEALTLASIIEKETAVDAERPLVASVFVNRLDRGMRLQTDPTVIYGMGDTYDGNIRKKDLRTPTPYNTYVINGLPPTPIAMVGEAAIAAALNPVKSNYFYFVASGHGDHVFSKTLAEHNRAVRAYLRVLRSQ